MSINRMVQITSPTPQKTERIGSFLGEMFTKGDIIAICGELGTGKTTLVRGMARGMGIEEGEVASPSFTLVNEYRGSLTLFHVDLYRLSGETELIGIDYEEYMRGEGVTVIEWADRIPRAVPNDALWITMRYLDAELREITLQGHGDRYEMMIEDFMRRVYNDRSYQLL